MQNKAFFMGVHMVISSFLQVSAVPTLCVSEKVFRAPAQRRARDQRLGRESDKDTSVPYRRPSRTGAGGERVECFGSMGITLSFFLCDTRTQQGASSVAVGNRTTGPCCPTRVESRFGGIWEHGVVRQGAVARVLSRLVAEVTKEVCAVIAQ